MSKEFNLDNYYNKWKLLSYTGKLYNTEWFKKRKNFLRAISENEWRIRRLKIELISNSDN